MSRWLWGARGRRPRCDRCRLLDNHQPDQCHAPNFASSQCLSLPHQFRRRLLPAPPAQVLCALRRLPPHHLCRRPRRRPLPLRRVLIKRGSGHKKNSGAAHSRSQSGAGCRTARGVAACSRAAPQDAPSAPPVVAQTPPPAPAPLAEPPLPPPAPGREAQEVAGLYAPKSLAQLVGTWAYSAADCDRLFQRRGSGWAYRQPVDKFAQAAIVELTKRILLPSAICRIDGASETEGALKVSADCEDSMSDTSRSVMIALRSSTELIYSASGDPALATTLKKCAQ